MPTAEEIGTAVPPSWGYHIPIAKHGNTFPHPEAKTEVVQSIHAGLN